MLFKHSTGNLILIIVMLLCYATVSSYGSAVNADTWRSFSNQTLYFLACDRCPIPSWLKQNQKLIDAFSKPDSRDSIMVIESFVEQALREYERDYFVWQGRIPLDINPRCIFGLFLANKLPDTKLATVGLKHFEQSVERSCLVALEKGTAWQRMLETELTKTTKDLMTDFKPVFFDEREIPFLLIYLIENGSSETVRQYARQKLAIHLQTQYGLEPALRQYRILLEGPSTILDDLTQLKIAQRFEEAESILDAQQLYERILQNTNSLEVATDATEHLARIRLANKDPIRAWIVLGVLRKRFPNTHPKSKDLEDFFQNFQSRRQEELKQIIERLSTIETEEKTWELCRLCDRLWTEEEAIEQWQNVIKNLQRESLVWQCAQLCLAQSLTNKGRSDEAKTILDALSHSDYPTIRARILLISADIVKRVNGASGAICLYQEAAQIERPTVFPQQSEVLKISQLNPKEMSIEESEFFASLLRGYNELINGNFEAASFDLLNSEVFARRVSRNSLVDNAIKAIPSLLMLSYLGLGDYWRAEQYGLQVIKNLAGTEQINTQISNLLFQIEQVDNCLFALSCDLRSLPEQGSRYRLTDHASKLYAALIIESSLSTDIELAMPGLVQLFWQIKRQQIKWLLSGEYDLVRTRLVGTDSLEEYPSIEPIIFTVQLLVGDSFKQISQTLATVTPPECVKGQMYRFAKFAQQAKRPDLARMALSVAAQQVEAVPGSVQLLNDIAHMYLEGNSHQKAIEIYERIVEQASDHNDAEKAQLSLIKIYAEQMKLYDKAIDECQKFISKFPNSTQVSQVEFQIGELAYLDKDYAGSTGQLDSFQRKYPDNPQVGQAMILAALSRMSEGNTGDAINRFTEIIRKYPDGDLAARSKFLIGYAQLSEQKYSHALETFKQLIEQFPESKYVEQANSFIERLSKVSSQ